MKTITAEFKILLIGCVTSFSIGAIVGIWFNHNKNSNNTIHNQIIQKNIVETQKIQNITSIKKNVLKKGKVIYIQKEFNKKGILKKESESQTFYISQNSIESESGKYEKDDFVGSEATRNTFTTTSQKNWSLGALIPTSNYTDYSNYTGQVSYRLYGQIWASFQTNLLISRPMMGFQIQFD